MIDSIFNSDCGKSIFQNALHAIKEYRMEEKIKSGVVVGLSGGPDSVMLLMLLCKLRRDYYNFPIVAVHVNHMIRAAEAQRDEDFCVELCKQMSIDLIINRVDVPSIANEKHQSIETAARDARYTVFREVIATNPNVCVIAVAHNASDNLETVLLNILRGSGISGAAGIPPVRDNIIRPLLYSSKSDILSALDTAGVKYVIDSTNFEVEYTRNYIRNEIAPLFKKITPNPEKMFSRLSQNLRENVDHINACVDRFIEETYHDDKVELKALQSIDKVVFSAFLTKIMRQKTGKTPEKTHIDNIFSLLGGGNFSYSLPGGLKFESEDGLCYIAPDTKGEKLYFYKRLSLGVNVIDGFSTVIIVGESSENCYSNIYKISIQQKFPRDIIDNGLHVRQKQDGDFYRYGGMSRKLKKVFNDRKVTVYDRPQIPVICDYDGILWVPGLPPRDGISGNMECFIALAEPIADNSTPATRRTKLKIL